MENGKQPINPSEGYIDQCEKSGMTQSGNGGFMQFHGLTKREYFAGLAMQGLLASNAIYKGRTDNREALAIDAIAFADELLKQLDNE